MTRALIKDDNKDTVKRATQKRRASTWTWTTLSWWWSEPSVWTTGLLAENKNNQTDPVGVRLVEEPVTVMVRSRWNTVGQWRDIVDSTLYSLYPWNLKAAAVICGRLDCGSALSVKSRRHVSASPLWWINPLCIQSTSTLKNCLTLGDMFSSSTLVLTCADSVRLVRGFSLCSGRLEVRSNQSWSSVCEEDLDLNDAQVVCRELGCGAPSVLQGALYGEGEAPIWTSKFQCGGNESALLDCRRSSSAKTCSPGKAAELTCADPVRLVGRPSRCAGTVEMENQRHWRPAGTSDHWSLQTGSAMCQQLCCGSAVSVKRRTDFPDRLVWFISSTCVKSASGLRGCLALSHKYNHTSALEVVCSDLLLQPIIFLSDGVSEAYQQGFRLLMGSNFTITCSVEPQFPGGSF
ncbi:scavenger receptor cysteine-rich type 1 protein M130-like [Sphaeramia orbicularis]|uniref:scavenger receptor cysteine-rich type 1 protein M130-like n=1 Tax=Sphaeramia orbicularis TaxID=375764 RepID=UPI00117CDB60|nr:scavenger receptor cysteine-rich type 1 protein M130-like [Sphaeramia orbicularis]